MFIASTREELAREVVAVNLDAPLARRDVLDHLTEHLDAERDLLVAVHVHPGVLDSLRAPEHLAEDPAADGLDEERPAPGSGRLADVETPVLAALPAADELLDLDVRDTQRPRDVVGRSDGQEGYGNAFRGNLSEDLAHGPVPAGHDDEVARTLERLLPVGLLRRGVRDLVPRFGDERAEVVCGVIVVAGRGVVDERDSHA
jgi:hypothetical protein